jgi:hypothetical protein
VITSKRNRQLALLRVAPNGLCDGLGDTRHEARVLEFPDGRVAVGRDLFELVVPVELDFPAELGELVEQARFDEVDGAGVDAYFGLGKNEPGRSEWEREVGLT